jgi:glucosylglycerol-phosphate synthase
VDYVKGAKEMLLCYERLLERRPEMQGKVNLIMTAVKAAAGMRVYKTAQSQIEQLAGKINGRFRSSTGPRFCCSPSRCPLTT